MVKVLIVAPEPVGVLMAGPAIRCWELAGTLAGAFDVTLAVPETPDLPAADFKLVSYRYGAPDSLIDLAGKADAVLLSGYLLARCPELARCGRPLIVDLYDPFPVENLGLHRGEPLDERTAINRGDFRTLIQLLQVGDFFLCGSERQRNFWLGMLAAAGRLNPRTYDADPSLRGLIDVVAVGISNETPAGNGAVKGIIPGIEAGDFLLVWPGGLWEWLDPLTAVEAVHLLASEAPDVKLLFPGMRHPHPERVGHMETPDAVLARAKDLGVLGLRVFCNDWTPYGERTGYLLDADVALSLHFDTLESQLAVRARLLDCLWAGTPSIATRGDVIAEAMAARGLAKIVAPRDPVAVAGAILSWRSERSKRATLAAEFRQMSDDYRWPVVSRPLFEFLRQPRLAADHLGCPGGSRETETDGQLTLDAALARIHLQDAELAAAHDLLHRIEQGKVMRLLNALHSAKRRLLR